MKIGIITMHRAQNFGSVLQTYALFKYLKKKQYDVEIIDYIPDRFRKKTIFNVNSDRYTKNGKKRIIKMLLLKSIVWLPKLVQMKKFNNFLRNNIELSKKSFYENCDNLDANDNYDIVITGSDQTWNTDWSEKIDLMYFLSFVPEKTKKVSYAASFSKEKLSDSEKEIIRPLLKRYNHITVREKSAIDILEDMNILNAKVTLDPVFLLNKIEWEELCSKRLIKEDYLLIYQMNSKINLQRIARVISRKLGVKVISVGNRNLFRKDSIVSKNVSFASPYVFLSMVKNARFILTDSFHGTAFSLLFEKQFISVRGNYPSRLENILRISGLSNRLINENDQSISQLVSTEIDYNNASALLNDCIRESKNELERIIKE